MEFIQLVAHVLRGWWYKHLVDKLDICPNVIHDTHPVQVFTPKKPLHLRHGRHEMQWSLENDLEQRRDGHDRKAPHRERPSAEGILYSC